MATETTNPNLSAPAPVRIPMLQNGDRLTLDEFLRRYEAMPEVRNAQLIEGVVYMPSPVTFNQHGNPHFNVIGWLFGYALATPGVAGGDNATIRLDVGNAPQPDAFLIVLPGHGGQVRITEEGYIAGGPELIVEVSATSVSIDVNAKLDAYLRNGVGEYVVWRVLDRAIDWFVLRAGRFDRLTPGPDTLLRSEVLPGLWLDPAALIAGDLPAVARAAQLGIATAEHAEFVARLSQAATNVPGN
jgi:Uma2 family endonuclease